MRTRTAAGALLAFLSLVTASGCTADRGREDPPQTPPPVVSPGAARSVGLPDEATLARAAEEVETLATARLAAQLVVPRASGGPHGADATLRRHGYGGVVLFAEDVPADPAARVPGLRRATDGYMRALAADGRDWPPFVAVDQEGGPVVRIGAPLTAFPSLMALGAAGDADLARAVGRASGAELAALGVTVVLAPSADVTIGPADPTIGTRSAGSDPEAVARLTDALTRGYLDARLVPTLKHFPGHGSVTTDSHRGSATQRAPLAALRSRDLLPFRTAVEAGAPAVMTGHVTLAALDDAPATLSERVTTGLLRDDLGFTGLVVTDALEMAAVTAGHDPGEAAVLAIEAGADVLLMPADPQAAVTALTQAVATGRISRARLVESAARMVATLRMARTGPRDAASGAPGDHGEVAARLARASITQLSGPCGERLVGPAVTVTGGSAADRAAFTAAARAAGLGIGPGTRVTLLGGGAYAAAEGEDPGPGDRPAGGDVVVALDVPYPLARAPREAVRIATYGRTGPTFTALADVLVGRAEAEGALPVAVGSAPVGSGCERAAR